MRQKKIIQWISVLVSISLLLLPLVFPICEVVAGKPPMRCYYTFQAEYILAILAIIISLSLFITKTREARKFNHFFLSILGLFAIVLPQSWAIGLCNHGDSPCHLTAHIETGAAILLILAGISGIWQVVKEEDKDREDHLL